MVTAREIIIVLFDIMEIACSKRPSRIVFGVPSMCSFLRFEIRSKRRSLDTSGFHATVNSSNVGRSINHWIMTSPIHLASELLTTQLVLFVDDHSYQLGIWTKRRTWTYDTRRTPFNDSRASRNCFLVFSSRFLFSLSDDPIRRGVRDIIDKLRTWALAFVVPLARSFSSLWNRREGM